MTSIADPKGQTFVQNTYDTSNRVSQQTLGTGTMLFSYGSGQTTLTDRAGNVTTYTFNSSGNPTRIETFTRGLRTGEPASYITQYTYNANMMMTTVTYPKGNGVKYVYDDANTNPRSRGNLLQVRRKADMAVEDNDTDDIVVNVTYEPQFNLPKTVTDAKGNVTTFTYDYELPPANPQYATKGNLVKITYPTVNGQTPQADFGYDALGQLTENSDPNGLATQYTYNALGQLVQVLADPVVAQARTQIAYDSFGNLATVTDPNNRTREYDFNALGWLIEERSGLGRRTKYTHDANGNVTQVERQANAGATVWQATQFTYDILNHLKTVTDPLSRVTTYNYDNNENLTSVVDANTKTIAYEYDERGLLLRELDAATPAGVTRYDYDLNGQLALLTDAKAQATTYSYNSFDRLVATTYPNAQSTSRAYDKNSNLTRLTPASNDPVDYVYDALNRLTAKQFVNHSGLNASFSYDVGGRMLTANTAASEVSYTYDTLSRVATTTQRLNSTNRSLTYSYDPAGNRTSVVYPSGKTISYTYDNDENLTQIRQNSVALVNQTYDVLGRRTGRNFTTTNLPQAAYSYDGANQLTQITNAILNGATVSQFGYTHDNVGNRLTMTTLAGTVNYGYNDRYELTAASGLQTHSYAYDPVANRTTADGESYTANNLNQYTAAGSVNPTYDVNGNLTYDGTNTLVYDELNRLATATNASHTASYAYDAFNRRVAKTVDGVTTYLVYDGDETIADYNSTGSLIGEYVYGEGIDEVLTMERGGTTYYYHQDALGSIREITTAAGAVVEKYDYDPYGKAIIRDAANNVLPASAISNRHLFTARELDVETGLYHYRARIYSADLGRFIQRDPIGYYDSLNPYQYTHNSPVNWRDPSGLQSIAEVCVVAGGTAAALEALINLLGAGGSAYLDYLLKKNRALPHVGSLNSDDSAAKDDKASPKPAEKTKDEQNEETPTTNPEKFRPIRGTSAKEHEETGEVMVKDKSRHGGDHYEVYRNRRDFEKGNRDRDVNQDGSARKPRPKTFNK